MYGVLNASDTAHYIRIQKAFLDESKSAIEMAQEPDSSFYKNLDVKILEYDSARRNIIGSYDLWRVNTTDELYKKDDPLSDKQFFTSPNYAYKFRKANLNSKFWYQLIINNQDVGRIDSSELFGIVNNDTLRPGNGFYIESFNIKNRALNFAKTDLQKEYKLFMFMPQNGRMIEGIIRFNYWDSNMITNQVVPKYADFHFDEELNATQGGQGVTLSQLNSAFYGFLNASIGLPEANTVRLIDTCYIFAYAASPEVYFNRQINLGQSGGLTADNIQPHYTTFKGKDVIGIVGSRAMRVYYNAHIDNETLQALKTNEATAPLDIRGRSGR